MLVITKLYTPLSLPNGDWQVEESNDHDSSRSVIATFHGANAESLALEYVNIKSRSADSRSYPEGIFPKGQLRMGG